MGSVGADGACENGVFRMGEARVVDRTGDMRLPIGDDGFERAMSDSVVVDKTLLVRDVIRGGTVSLFCRPRRFGKTFALTMLRSFFEDTGPLGLPSRARLFEGMAVADAASGKLMAHQGAHPVIYFSFNDLKKLRWEEAYAVLRSKVATEYSRHAYLADSDRLGNEERAYFARVAGGSAEYGELARSLEMLALMLRRHHLDPERPDDHGVVILIDEYDAPVMAGHENGYYDEVVGFLKGWLTGALKDGGQALYRAALTGVQRIAKESIFSDLNNLVVSTPLDSLADERFGFTQGEVVALATYLGAEANVDELRAWYDGYRFGGADVYNPWSVLSYLSRGCVADTYWSNTTGSGIIGEVVTGSGAGALEKVCALTEPGGEVRAALDLGIVFPELGVRGEALWSFLYLAGYLTTRDTAMPNDVFMERCLYVPNLEMRRLLRREVVLRFADWTDGVEGLRELQRAVVAGDAALLESRLRRVLCDSSSYYDLEGENSYHMLMLGLLYDTEGYLPPVSNREAGEGRFDLRLVPREPSGGLSAVTLEFKVLSRREAARACGGAIDEDGGSDAPETLRVALAERAAEALGQIRERAYDEDGADNSGGCLRYGIAFAGKRTAVVCERA